MLHYRILCAYENIVNDGIIELYKVSFFCAVSFVSPIGICGPAGPVAGTSSIHISAVTRFNYP